MKPPTTFGTSGTRWLEYLSYIVKFIAIKNFQIAYFLPKLVHKFDKYSTNPQRNGQRLLKLCQSGKFLPNVVTLNLNPNCKLHFHSFVFAPPMKTGQRRDSVRTIATLKNRFFSDKLTISVTIKKLPNHYKSCPKMISLEKLKILTPSQNCPRKWGDLDKLIVSKVFEKLPKVQ